MKMKRLTSAALAATCLGVVAAVAASAPAGAYIVPEIPATPDTSTVLGSVTVILGNDEEGGVRYDGAATVLGDAVEWTWTTPTSSWGEPCSAPPVSVDIDLYPPTVSLAVSDSSPCVWNGIALGIRIKGADFTGITVSGGNDNVFVEAGPGPLSNRLAKPGRLSSALPTSLTPPNPVPGAGFGFFEDSDGSWYGYFEWYGAVPARLDGTSVLSLVMAGVPAAPVGAGANFAG